MATTARYEEMWLKLIVQMTGILLLGSLLGLSVNSIRQGSLPLIKKWSPKTQLSLDSEDSITISLDEAEALYCSQGAIFLDARSRELYTEAHIQGALSLPWDDYETYYARIMEGLPFDTPIVVYCDGVGCGLSRDLALALLDKGYTNVRVLPNAWALWQRRNLPTETNVGRSG
jgi:rhodanese-related sulfurtransferase